MRMNYFNFKDLYDGRILVTNDAGYYYKLDRNDFQRLIEGRFEGIDGRILTDLAERYFVFDENE